MDNDIGLPQLSGDFLLQLVTDTVGFIDTGFARHHQVEVNMALATYLARP